MTDMTVTLQGATMVGTFLQERAYRAHTSLVWENELGTDRRGWVYVNRVIIQPDGVWAAMPRLEPQRWTRSCESAIPVPLSRVAKVDLRDEAVKYLSGCDWITEEERAMMESTMLPGPTAVL